MHNGNPDTSMRLYRALELLKAAGTMGCTTAEIQAWTQSMAPATDISELRQSGHQIACNLDKVRSNGRRVYRYRYQGKKES